MTTCWVIAIVALPRFTRMTDRERLLDRWYVKGCSGGRFCSVFCMSFQKDLRGRPSLSLETAPTVSFGPATPPPKTSQVDSLFVHSLRVLYIYMRCRFENLFLELKICPRLSRKCVQDFLLFVFPSFIAFWGNLKNNSV